MAGVMIVFLILALVLGIFVIPVIAVGHNRYYMESRLMGRSGGLWKAFVGLFPPLPEYRADHVPAGPDHRRRNVFMRAAGALFCLLLLHGALYPAENRK